MSPRTRAGLGVGLALGVIGLLSLDPPAPAPPGSDPLYAEARVALAAALDRSGEQLRLPVAWAAPRIGRLGLAAWLATLDLPPEVRARIDARVEAKDLVDELVPFALFVKETYADPGVPPFAPAAEPAPPAEQGAAVGISGAQAAMLLRLYDAAYLQGREAAAGVSDRLACDADDSELTTRAERARPILRELLVAHRDTLEAGQLRDGVDRMLGDEGTLTTITISLLEFVDDEVCKHYGVFAPMQQPADVTASRLPRGRRAAVRVLAEGGVGPSVECGRGRYGRGPPKNRPNTPGWSSRLPQWLPTTTSL